MGTLQVRSGNGDTTGPRGWVASTCSQALGSTATGSSLCTELPGTAVPEDPSQRKRASAPRKWRHNFMTIVDLRTSRWKPHLGHLDTACILEPCVLTATLKCLSPACAKWRPLCSYLYAAVPVTAGKLRPKWTREWRCHLQLGDWRMAAQWGNVFKKESGQALFQLTGFRQTDIIKTGSKSSSVQLPRARS